jgi:pimeloyl-ACP methyl ester carboxylesterase
MGGGAQWPGVAEDLSDCAEVFALDLPGFGASADMPPLDRIEEFADWVIALLLEHGIESYHLLGHSMGGMIAQEIARRDAGRVKRLILYATGARGVLPGRFETIAESKKRAQVDGATDTARRIAATWFLKGTAAPGYEACARIASQSSLAAILAGLDAMEHWSGEHRLKDITQDTLILWGSEDRSYGREQVELLASQIPRSTLRVVPGRAHALHLEDPASFIGPLREHICVDTSSKVDGP